MNNIKIISLLVSLFCFLSAISQTSQTGNISGKILNIKNNEPLPFVNIGIIGTDIGTSSDAEGNFTIKDIPIGFYSISASSVGYENVSSEEFQVISNKTFFIEIKMRESDVSLNEVTVKANILQNNDKAPVSIKNIGIQEIENSPGANRDVAKVIQNLPGVANVPALNRNDIFIRGGAGSESKFYLDDIEIPNINHFATQGSSGGANGILNADFMREVKFYSAAFPASKANALSAVFCFKQIDGNKEKIKLRTSIGASEVSLVADGPINKKTTFIASVRRSYLQYLFKFIGLPFLPTFNDYQIKVKHKINTKNEISILSIGALDNNRLHLDMKEPDERQQYILDYLPESKQWNYVVGAVWKHFYKKGYSTVVLSRNMLTNEAYKYLDNNKANDFLEDYKSTETENKFRWENNIYFANNLDINFGVDVQYERYTNSTFRKLFILDTVVTLDFDSKLNFLKYSAFVQVDKKLLNKKLLVSAAYKILGNTYSNKMNNPFKQSSLQTKIAYSFTPKISAHIHAGRFFQLPAYTALGYRNNDNILVNKNNLSYIHADHFVVGMSIYPYNQGLISIESFYKRYNNYPFSIKDNISLAHRTIDFGTIGNEELVSTSDGRSYGIELLSQNRFSNNLNLLLSYTFSVSQFRDINNEWKPTAWDNRHVFIITMTKKLKHYWDIGIKWRYAGGLPYSPYNLERSSHKIAWDIRHRAYFDYSKIMTKRLSAFHQLDLRINKSFFIKKTELKLYFDIQNLYNFKFESIDYYTNKDENGNIMIKPDDSMHYKLRPLKNDGSGTVLPTFGLIFNF